MAEGLDPARRLGLPYDGVKPRSVQGRIQEKKMAKERGARLHPMSGAGRIKDDASTDDTEYEFKLAGKSHVVKGAELYQLFVRAIRQGKEPVYAVYFDDVDITLEATLTRGKVDRG